MRTLSLHSHTVYSQRDSIIKPDDAAAKIKANGGTHYSVTDHGTIQGWLAVRDACEKNGLVPVYGNELYVNDFLPLLMLVRAAREAARPKDRDRVTLETIQQHALQYMNEKQLTYFLADVQDLSVKDRAKRLFNRLAFAYQHLVAVAQTPEGRENLIRLSNKGWMDGYYHKPQVTTQDCLAHADGIIWTTACLGGPISRAMQVDPTGEEGMRYLKQWEHLKDRFYLEVQPLDLIHQRRYNQHLIELARRSGFPLILSQDNHHLDEEEWIAHRMLMLGQNDRTLREIEDYYEYKGREVSFSDLKKQLGVNATWKMQEILEQEGIQRTRSAGHHYGDVKLHWRTNDEVRRQIEVTNPELLPVVDEALSACDAICDMIEPIGWDTQPHIPHFDDARQKVLKLCSEQLVRLGLQNDDRYVQWLRKEDRVINACGFYDYVWTLYLLTSEVQRRGIPIGYARGSGGGCLIMYLLGIIRVDPVQYGLFFDRFLNPARLGLNPVTLEKEGEPASYPDVDLDFSSIHRKEVIDIAEDLFGRERVVPVGTVGEAKLRTALADLCRVCEIPPSEFMPVSKELPDDATNPISFERAMRIPAFAKFVEKHPVIGRFLSSLIGTMRNTGQHAGGVCIADRPIATSIPVVRAGAKEGGNLVTGFGESGSVRALESIGFIKFDCLATDTVDHVSLCASHRYDEHLARGGEPWVAEGERMLYPEQMPDYRMDDPKVMQTIFHTGRTDGIFQFEESIGKDQSRLIKPDTIMEVADISTMIRPGCLQAPAVVGERNEETGMVVRSATVGLHFEYAARKFDPACNPPPEGLPEPILEVLEPTHYCCIYQEQMMILIERLTNGKMALGEGDMYRRAIEHAGKKKPGAKEKVDELEAQMRTCSEYPPEVVDRVCKIIKGGANYAFNKSHSLSYSLFSYAQAWFKTYYPHIFFAAHVTLLAVKGKKDKVHKIVNNARAFGIHINPPHIKWSGSRATWSEDGRNIFLPFTMMNGFRTDASEAVQELAKGVTTIREFLWKAVKDKRIRKNHAITLAKAGSFENLEDGLDRLKSIAMTTWIWDRIKASSSQESFDKAWDEGMEMFTTIAPPSKSQLTAYEMEVFNGHINECPLDSMSESLKKSAIPLSQVEPGPEDSETVHHVYFMVTSIQKKTHKSGKNQGKEWYRLTCWDGEDVCELCIWSSDLDDYERDDGNVRPGYRRLLEANQVYTAYIRRDGDRPASLAFRGGKYPETLFIHPIG